jgi:hypothetical protein
MERIPGLVSDRPLRYRVAIDPALDDQLRDLTAREAPRLQRLTHGVARAIAAQCILRGMTDQGALSYSRRAEWWHGRGIPRPYTFNRTLAAIDGLTACGLIEGHRAQPNQGDGFQSVIWASPALIEWAQGLTLPATPLVRDVGPLLRYRDCDGFDYAPATLDKGMARDVAELTAALSGVRVQLQLDRLRNARTGPGGIVSWDIPKKKGEGYRRYAAQIGPASFFRSFKDLAEGGIGGGRFYDGDGVQRIPKADRRPKHGESAVTMDGEDTAEPDFPAHHVRMLYAKAGAPCPDPESLHDYPGLDHLPKDARKGAVFGLINAPSKRAAIQSLADYPGRKSPGLPYADAAALVDAVEAKHASIAGAFGRGEGLRLQLDDSAIALAVLKDLAREGIPAWPIHDSFLCKKRHEGRVRQAMADAFDQYRQRVAA